MGGERGGPFALEGRHLRVRYGGIEALAGVSVGCAAGEVVAVIGPNGAGKSTLFNALCGLAPTAAGEVRLAGRVLGHGPLAWRSLVAASLALGLLLALLLQDANALWRRTVVEPYRAQVLATRTGEPTPPVAYGRALLAALGDEPWIRAERDGFRVCEGDRLVASARTYAGAVSLRDAALCAQRGHVRRAWLRFVGTLALASAGVFACGWRAARRASRGPRARSMLGVARTFQNIRLFDAMSARDNVQVVLEQGPRAATAPSAEAFLDRLELGERADVLAGNLSYGERRRLEIARALASDPRVLLLDEPAAGLHAGETAELLALVRQLRDQGLAILLIEHDMALVMGVSDHVLVLDHGAAIACGTPAEVRAHPAVIAAYLGEHPDAAAARAARKAASC